MLLMSKGGLDDCNPIPLALLFCEKVLYILRVIVSQLAQLHCSRTTFIGWEANAVVTYRRSLLDVVELAVRARLPSQIGTAPIGQHHVHVTTPSPEHITSIIHARRHGRERHAAPSSSQAVVISELDF